MIELESSCPPALIARRTDGLVEKLTAAVGGFEGFGEERSLPGWGWARVFSKHEGLEKVLDETAAKKLQKLTEKDDRVHIFENLIVVSRWECPVEGWMDRVKDEVREYTTALVA